MFSRKQAIVLLVFTLQISLLFSVGFIGYNETSSQNNSVSAQEGLTVTIRREQQYFINDTVITHGYIHWSDLADGQLYLYTNTSELFEYAFWDAIGNYSDERVIDDGDKLIIRIRTTELYYKISGVYHPDYFMDTNFIVIFNTFWAQFSYITPDNEQRYAPVNYYNKQLLPKGAGIVSFAPTDGATIIREKGSFGVVWGYEERAMDPFHDPLTYEITYNFDPIYLQFTEQMFEKQQQIDQQQREQQLLDQLRASFRFIAFLALILSLLASLIGYLLAKRKLQTKLDEARSLPRRLLRDIEAEEEPGKRVSSMFSLVFIGLVLSSSLIALNIDQEMGGLVDNQQMGIGLSNVQPLQENRRINYKTIIDLGREGIALESVTMELPYTVGNFSIWVQTDEIVDFKAYDERGVQVSYQKFSNRYLITNVEGYIRYEMIRPYTYYNNSNILVYLDYFFLEFYDYELEDYSKADISFTVIIPEGAFLYSASPSNLLEISYTPEGRTKVIFTDENRAIDPYHDPFSAQVTYAFIDVLEAIQDEEAIIRHFRTRTELTEEEIKTLRQNVIFISLIALIAPILAFLLSYYIMRNKMLKKIKEEEEKHELLIPVEEVQIQSLIEAQKIDLDKEPWKAILGGYWELLAYLSRFTPVNLLSAQPEKHKEIITKYMPSFLITETLEFLSVGKSINEKLENNEQIFYNKAQARDYLTSVMKLMEKLEKWRNEQ